MFSTESSNHGTPLQNGTSSNHVDGTDGKPAPDEQPEDGPDNV